MNRIFPRSKEKRLPHNRSRATGMIGTCASRAIRSKPFAKPSMAPERVIAPSAKMQTRSPPAAASEAFFSEFRFSSGVSPEETGMTPMRFANHPRTGTSKKGVYIRKRGSLGSEAATSIPSTKET